ncbi:Sulfotransferase family protein [Fodinibius salinus]|uniref:Sulfotransferase family protein n=1 Tax=Fodinibius salinus TaxID=860790 RepID=A0A5D3YFD7_9BACT|nr:sulfotransferase [Fodinibius salinus]TYP91723.1 Sulfotransferase family protein [Fodinibius salinus]
MDCKRIYILYSERSGSNLLRLLLGNHPELSAPVSPQLFDSFIPFADRFGDLRNKKNSIRLLSLMKKYANHPFSDWQLDTSAEEMYSQSAPKSFVEAVDTLYSTKALQDGKSGYVCKERHLFNYSGLITTSLSAINWVYLYRDPRDVVSSWLKNKMLFFTPYGAAHAWKEDQQKCRSLHLSHHLPYHRLSYEELITLTKQTMTNLLQYLNLDIDERCFQNQQKREEADRNVLWKNLDKPIDSSNTQKYRDRLSQKQVAIVESICQSQMQHLGYPLETNGQWTPAIGDKNYQYFNKVKELVKQKTLANNKTSELLRDRKKLKQQLISRL